VILSTPYSRNGKLLFGEDSFPLNEDPIFFSDYQDGILLASTQFGSTTYLIDDTGKIILTAKKPRSFICRVDGGNFLLQENGKYGVLNQEGNTLIPFEYGGLKFKEENKILNTFFSYNTFTS
jgi:hypothetical protein